MFMSLPRFTLLYVGSVFPERFVKSIAHGELTDCVR